MRTAPNRIDYVIVMIVNIGQIVGGVPFFFFFGLVWFGFFRFSFFSRYFHRALRYWRLAFQENTKIHVSIL